MVTSLFTRGCAPIGITRDLEMSFFNLTHTGVQDPFKTAACANRDKKNDAVSDTNEKEDAQSSQSETRAGEASTQESGAPPSHVQTMYSPSGTGETGRDWHRGSHSQYTELLRKHQRQPQGPMELYQHPLTSSCECGWWLKDGSPHREEWAQSERHAHVNSEMTRFVDDMSLTNKEFSLY